MKEKEEVKTWKIDNFDFYNFDGRIETDYTYSDDIEMDVINRLHEINPEKYIDDEQLIRKFFSKSVFKSKKDNILKQVKVKYLDNYYAIFDYRFHYTIPESYYWGNRGESASGDQMVIIDYLLVSIEDKNGNKFDYFAEIAKYEVYKPKVYVKRE